MDRDEVLDKLRPKVVELLNEIENDTLLKVQFKALPNSCSVVAMWQFTPPCDAAILLREGRKDVDVAHELLHFKTEFVDGYAVPALRQGVNMDDNIRTACGDTVHSYVNDIVVFEQMQKMGFAIDGDILRAQLFDDMYTTVPKRLAKHCSRRNDGMAHLDNIGFGDLRRSCFLVHAELFLERYTDFLKPEHLARTKEFVASFRKYRHREARKADKVLSLFNTHDVMDTQGQKQILSAWLQLGHLDTHYGVSVYVKANNGYILPYPVEV